MASIEEPFSIFLRRDNAYENTLTVRFQTDEGLGVLGIRKVGRSEAPPSAYFEENDVELEALRSGRFVHVLHGGQRQSFALSRLSPEVCQRLPHDAWTELRPHVEFGFRYLVIPDDALPSGAATAAVQVAVPPLQLRAGVATGPPSQVPLRPAAASGPPTPTSGLSLPPAGIASQVQGVPSPAPMVATAAGTSSPPSGAPQPEAPLHRSPNQAPESLLPGSSARYPRQVPVEPGLAQAALDHLGREQAVAMLKAEMAKVDALQRRADELERELRLCEERERDLFNLLAKWRSRGG